MLRSIDTTNLQMNEANRIDPPIWESSDTPKFLSAEIDQKLNGAANFSSPNWKETKVTHAWNSKFLALIPCYLENVTQRFIWIQRVLDRSFEGWTMRGQGQRTRPGLQLRVNRVLRRLVTAFRTWAEFTICTFPASHRWPFLAMHSSPNAAKRYVYVIIPRSAPYARGDSPLILHLIVSFCVA